jgi:hypothetical protein
MRNTFLLFAFSLFLIPIVTQAQEKEINPVIALLDQQQTDWNDGNIEGFMKGYWQSDSLVFIGSSGVSYGWQKVLDNYKKKYSGPNNMGQLSFKIVKLYDLNEQYKFVIGKWKLEFVKDFKEGHFTLLLQKIGDKWVIIADHSS